MNQKRNVTTGRVGSSFKGTAGENEWEKEVIRTCYRVDTFFLPLPGTSRLDLPRRTASMGEFSFSSTSSSKLTWRSDRFPFSLRSKVAFSEGKSTFCSAMMTKECFFSMVYGCADGPHLGVRVGRGKEEVGVMNGQMKIDKEKTKRDPTEVFIRKVSPSE